MAENKQTPFTAADAIVRELVRAGVEVAFGIVSIHNLPIYEAIRKEGSIRLVCARGESGAVNMADGYARATGKLGVAITSTGTGAGNAAGALAEAWSAGAPVLHLTSEVASPYRGTGRGYIHECKDQLSMMDGASKKAIHLWRPGQAAAVIRLAIQEACAIPSGPVTVQIPIDFQSAIVPESQIEQVQVNLQKAGVIRLNIPDNILRKMAASKRPVIWAGGGVIAADASSELTELAEWLEAPVITSQSGRGAIPEDHPLCIGHFASFERTKQLLGKSDFLISAGVRFRSHETDTWKMEIPADHLSIDADLHAVNRNFPVNCSLIGNAKVILRSLLEALKKRERAQNPEYRKEILEIRTCLRRQVRDTLGPYEKILDAMRTILPRNAILVRDVTIQANVWGSRLFEIYEPRTSIHAAGGGIGQGLPMAIGAQIGRKDRVVVLMAGDGGFMVNVGELATAAQENLPLIIVLFDDGGYGVLRNIQDAVYGQRIAVDLLSPDFVELGHSMGFASVTVGSPEQFASALAHAVQARKPSMIVVDMNAVGPMAKPFGGPPGAKDVFRPHKQ